MNFFTAYFYSQIIQNSTTIFVNSQFTMHNAQIYKKTPTMVGADLWSPAVVGV